MNDETRATPEGLCHFINQCPSPYHVCVTAAHQLHHQGYQHLHFSHRWPTLPGCYFVQQGGTLIAWNSCNVESHAPFRIIGAHTDSPNLRIKHHPDRYHSEGHTVALHPYGGAWLHSWFNRELGISGRVFSFPDHCHLIRIDNPVLYIPQLAIHLSAHPTTTWTVDPQNDLYALWCSQKQSRSFLDYLGEVSEIDPQTIISFDLMVHDLTPAHVLGADQGFISASRLDNQASCYAALCALLTSQSDKAINVIALFNHEEVGSSSAQGAASGLLLKVLERISLSLGDDREDFLCRVANSVCLSADMAHGTHPNFPDKHDPGHPIRLNNGPVIKHHPNLRYGTDSFTAMTFIHACQQHHIPYQYYEHRADLQCGSTIGPLLAAQTTIPVVDAGIALLGMHASRELIGSNDIIDYTSAMQAFLTPQECYRDIFDIAR